jgi:hypothetical protein
MRYNDLMAPQTHISRQLYESVKLNKRRMCDLAADAGLDSSTLSLVMHRRRKVRVNDPRFIRLGRLVGVSKADLFEPIEKSANGKARVA